MASGSIFKTSVAFFFYALQLHKRKFYYSNFIKHNKLGKIPGVTGVVVGASVLVTFVVGVESGHKENNTPGIIRYHSNDNYSQCQNNKALKELLQR